MVVGWCLCSPVTVESGSGELPGAFMLMVSWAGRKAGQPGLQKAKNSCLPHIQAHAVSRCEHQTRFVFLQSVMLSVVVSGLPLVCHSTPLHLSPVLRALGSHLSVSQPAMALAMCLSFLSTEGNGSCEHPRLSQKEMWKTVGSTAGCINHKVLQGHGRDCSLCFALWKRAVVQVQEGHPFVLT